MEIEVREEGSARVVVCRGRMDANVSGSVKERIVEQLDQGGVLIVVDLTEVGFLDSSGLGALVASLRKVKERKGEIRLVGLRPEVRSIFDITRVARLFQIHQDVREALEATRRFA